MPITIQGLLKEVHALNGSDLHLVAGLPPMARVAGEMTPLQHPPLDAQALREILDPTMTDEHRKTLKAEQRANYSYAIAGQGRYRFNVCQSLGSYSATIRLLLASIPPLANLGLPAVVATLTERRAGIVLVTGSTGSGKSTTLAAMLQHVNLHGRPSKIVTIEDPIENLIPNGPPGRSVIMQREVGFDTPSFEDGLMDSLRQDPDIICVGEMRSPKSIMAALLAAETGHLVLTTLHTKDAAKSAQRIITAVSLEAQESLREQLAMTLDAVISQQLLPRSDRKGLVLVADILIATPATRQLVRENRLEQINDAILSGGHVGMVSKDAWLAKLFEKRIVSKETATANMRNPSLLGSAATQAAPALTQNAF